MKLTQAKMAEELGISVISVQNWESGRKPPSPDNIFALAKLSGESPDWLAGDDVKLPSFTGSRQAREITPSLALEVLQDIIRDSSEIVKLRRELEETRAENQRLRAQLESVTQAQTIRSRTDRAIVPSRESKPQAERPGRTG